MSRRFLLVPIIYLIAAAILCKYSDKSALFIALQYLIPVRKDRSCFCSPTYANNKGLLTMHIKMISS
jgi:hypothetical protein